MCQGALDRAATNTPTPTSVGRIHSGLIRTTTVLIEKVGMWLTIRKATTTMTMALSAQMRGQSAWKANAISIGMIAQPAAAGAGMPVKKRDIHAGRSVFSSSVLKRARRSAQQVANSRASAQPSALTWCSDHR